MAAIAASNVTFTPSGRSNAASIEDNSGRYKVFTVTFGNGTLTYPSGGVPLSGLSKVGFPNTVGSVILEDSGSADGFLYKWSKANNTVRIYQSPALAGLAGLTEFTTSATPAATTLVIRVYGK